MARFDGYNYKTQLPNRKHPNYHTTYSRGRNRVSFNFDRPGGPHYDTHFSKNAQRRRGGKCR